jgi:hypothetical protein
MHKNVISFPNNFEWTQKLFQGRGWNMELPIGIHCELTPTHSMLDSTWFWTWKFVTQLKLSFFDSTFPHHGALPNLLHQHTSLTSYKPQQWHISITWSNDPHPMFTRHAWGLVTWANFILLCPVMNW